MRDTERRFREAQRHHRDNHPLEEEPEGPWAEIWNARWPWWGALIAWAFIIFILAHLVVFSVRM